MPKLVLDNLVNLQNENTAVTTINDNNDAIEAAIENTLSRDGTTPNQMGSNLDMNSWHILNLPEPSSDTDPIRRIDLVNVSQVTNVLHTTSSTSNTIGLGNKTFTVPSGLGFFPGQYLLVQDALSSLNYMVGRVVSYSGTSLVFNSTVVAGSGTKTNWTIDLSGAPGPVSTVYDTVLNAIGATIPAPQTFLALSGYVVVGDGGSGMYKRQVVMPTHAGRFQSVDGSWWELVSETVTPEMFNCVGDGVTNDQANFQNCIDFVGSRGGGNIKLTPGKTYRIAISGVLTGLNMKPYVHIYFNGSTISLENNDGSLGLRMNTGTGIHGPGNLLNPVSVAPGGSQSMYHAAISFGELNGNEGTVASPSPLTTINNIMVEGLTITGARPDGTIVCGLGGIHDITVQNNIFPDNSTNAVAVGFDWGNYGSPVPGPANVTGARTNFDLGTFYTIHPHNIRVLNNQIGNMTHATGNSSMAVRMSGCYEYTVRGNDIQSTNSCGIFQTGGDYGFEFSSGNERLNACKNIVIENNNVRNYKGGFGVVYDAYPDNVFRAVFDPLDPSFPYASISPVDGYLNNGRIVGNNLQTSSVVNLESAIQTGYTRGLYVADNSLGGNFQGNYGIRCVHGSNEVIIENNEIHLFNFAGIYVNDTGTIPYKVIIRKNRVSRCGNGGANNANILIDSAIFCTISDNIVGEPGEDMAMNGIRVTANTVYTTITNNLVPEVKAGGVAYALNTIGSIWVFKDNIYAGVQAYVSGLSIVPYRRDFANIFPTTLITHAHSARAALTSDITPTFGTWGAGSTCTNVDSVTGQVYLSKCTVSGTPGTWRAVSTVA